MTVPSSDLALNGERLRVTDQDAGQRLDVALARELSDFSRSELQTLIGEGAVLVNGIAAKPSTRLKPGDEIIVRVRERTASESIEPEDIPLNIVYEDENLVVLDKPPGMVVHPAVGHSSGTLVHALVSRYPELLESGEQRPGIVHRLDKDTSGLMLVARNKRALWYLQEQMKARRVHKEYTLLCCGALVPPSAKIEAPIGRHPADRKKVAIVSNGRPALTEYRTLESLDRYTLARAWLHTGRTHQIRVHFSSIGHPLAGDAVYGRCELPGLGRQFLHSTRLALRLWDGREMEWTSPLPPDLEAPLQRLRGD